jgi:DNA-binding PadR family transcriptional regulator
MNVSVFRSMGEHVVSRSRQQQASVRPSPVKSALLALLIERPTYTYELSKRFDQRFGDLFGIGQARVYQLVTEMLGEELIEIMGQSGGRSSRQPKPHYRATKVGARLHREWLASTFQDDPLRTELLLRLLSTGTNDARSMLMVVDSYERMCLDEMVTSGTQESPIRPRGLREVLIAEQERLLRDARLKWAAFARKQIRVQMTNEP